MSQITITLGRIYLTPTVEESIDRPDIDAALGRHARADWGNISPNDWHRELVLVEGECLISAHNDRRNRRFYIMTKFDHSMTTVLMSEDC